jgi:hypothetical protein
LGDEHPGGSDRSPYIIISFSYFFYPSIFKHDKYMKIDPRTVSIMETDWNNKLQIGRKTEYIRRN